MSTPVQPMATCPFCDSDDVKQVVDRAVCKNCSATGPPALTSTESSAVWRKWNSRASRHQWRELEGFICDAVTSWGDHFGVETRDLIGPDKVPPVWQQVRQVLSRVLDR
jgi:hypothetical protein